MAGCAERGRIPTGEFFFWGLQILTLAGPFGPLIIFALGFAIIVAIRRRENWRSEFRETLGSFALIIVAAALYCVAMAAIGLFFVLIYALFAS
ncbi:MAG: hypothetical protein WAT70_06750 [Rhizobiaceae bacterium]